jgi:hypothetical protein
MQAKAGRWRAVGVMFLVIGVGSLLVLSATREDQWSLHAVFREPLSTIPPTVQPCDDAAFVRDVTVEDGSTFVVGQTFTKTWLVRNTGTCPWTLDYTFKFVEGTTMGGETTVPLPHIVEPGALVEFSVHLTAPPPLTSIRHRGVWRMHNANGKPFGDTQYVDIRVPANTAGDSEQQGAP